MIKPLLSSAVVLLLLCGPAFAESGRQPTPPPTLVRFQIKVTSSTASHNYELAMLSDSCGSIEERVSGRNEEVKLCARDVPGALRVGVQYKISDQGFDHNASFEVVIAKGKSIEVGRENGGRLTLTLM